LKEERRQKLRDEMVSMIMHMDVKSSDDEFVRCGCSDEKELIEVFKRY